MEDKNYRNPKILAWAKDVPGCMYCSAPNHGQIVACHANMQKFGKSMGQKASDVPIAYLCMLCHDLYDGRIGPHNTKEFRDSVFYEGACRTWLWLMQEGLLEVK